MLQQITHLFRLLICFAFFALPGLGSGQTAPGTVFEGLEGNWIVRWSGIQENRLTQSKISLFRNREAVCIKDDLGHCQYHQKFSADGSWVLDGRAADTLDYGYVQELTVSPDGASAEIHHSPGIMGHWGGVEKLRRADADSLKGEWNYKDWAGQGLWQREQPIFTTIEVSGRDVGSATPLGANRIAIGMTWNKYSWPAWITAGGNRPRLYVKVRGSNLWGHHFAAFENSPGLYVSRPFRRGDEQGEYLELEVSIWPGASTGTHVLWIGDQQLYLDLTISGQPVDAELYVKPGTSSESAPMQPVAGRNQGPANTVRFQAVSSGEQLATKFDLTLKSEAPVELFVTSPCRTVDYQTARCRITSESGRVAEEIAFWANPLSEPGSRIAVPVTISGSVQGADSDEWFAVAPYTAQVYLRDCNGAYAARVATTTESIKHLADTLTANASPVPALPGKRLYEGPTKPIGLNEAQTYRVKLMTDQMAQGKSPDGYLASALNGGGALGQIIADLQIIPTGAQCANRDAHLAALADLRAAQATFQRRAAEIYELAASVGRANQAVDKIVAERIKAFSGQLPQGAQTFLGVGGTTSADFDRDGILVGLLQIGTEGASNRFSGDSFVAALVGIPKAIGEFLAVTPGMDKAWPKSTAFFGKAPGMLALAIGGIQIGISTTDLTILTATWADKEELTSWIEANAYFTALDFKYRQLDVASSTALDALEAALQTNPCTCQN